MKFPEQLRFQGIPEYRSRPGDPFGWFVIQACMLVPRGLKMMACDGKETSWEHVSVSHLLNDVTPTWEEMTLAASLFWDDDETLVQYRPPKSDYVNQHPGCLHWFRWVGFEFPRPPKTLI